MVNLQREGLNLLYKIGRAAFAKSQDTTEVPEDLDNLEPMKVYWEKEKELLNEKKRPFIDRFINNLAQDRLQDSTPKPIAESHYDFETLSLFYLPEYKVNDPSSAPFVPPLVSGVSEGAPKAGSGISTSGRDAGVVAGIVVAVISGVIILAALIAVVMYRHYVHRNVTSMNFDNPVYRKTTEDQFALEKNGYAPGSKLYPSTVGEEAQEPLNTPGTNEFV